MPSNDSFRQADSFKNEASACPYEWNTESLTQMIQNSKTRVFMSSPVCVCIYIYIQYIYNFFVYS